MQLELAHGVQIKLTEPPYETEGLRMAIIGNPGMGKSNIMAVLAEEAYSQGIPFLFFDPNGDACSLRELGPDVVVVGHPGHDEPLRRAHYPLSEVGKDGPKLVRMLLEDDYSLVVDLSDQDDPDLAQFAFARLVNEHFRLAGKMRTPALVLVDEAHIFAPEGRADEAETASRKALFKVAHDGRKRGMMLVVASQRSTFLSKRVIFGSNVRIFGKTTYRPDYDQVVRKYLSVVSFQQLLHLRTGEVFLVGENIMGESNLGKVQVKRRKTTDLGRTPVIRARKKAALGQLALFEALPAMEKEKI